MSTLFLKNGNKSLLSLPVRASTYHQDPLLYIDREANYIQRNLQVLIDAQSEGLLAGLTGAPHNDVLSNESYTPTTPSRSESPSTIPVQQPVAKKIGLRAAREGIFKSIYDLLKLKEEEREIITFRLEERKDALVEIDEFSTKRAGLEEAIATIRNDRESKRTKELQDESRRLETDIHELETRVLEMKARHRHVVQELSRLENAVESKLSSYTNSLSLMQSDIRKFLQNPPIQPQSSSDDRPTFYSLNPKRRTLEMVQEHWRTEQAELQRRQQGITTEIQALEEGGGVWKQVVGEVSGFEKRLRAAMRRSIQTQSQLLRRDGPSGSKFEEDHARTIIEDLEKTTDRVEQHLQLSVDKGWKLLVCCISAELEALQEAREMLLNAFNIPEEDKRQPEDENDSQADPLGVDDPEPPADLLRDTEHHSQDEASRLEDEDDDPDPAWLLSES